MTASPAVVAVSTVAGALMEKASEAMKAIGFFEQLYGSRIVLAGFYIGFYRCTAVVRDSLVQFGGEALALEMQRAAEKIVAAERAKVAGASKASN